MAIGFKIKQVLLAHTIVLYAFATSWYTLLIPRNEMFII